MPNKTIDMSIEGILNNRILQNPDIFNDDLVHIIKDISNKYPGAIYNMELDQFEYKAERLDYFVSGMAVNTDGEFKYNSYMLVDPDDNRNWFFTAGSLEENFQRYLDIKYPKIKEKSKAGFWKSLLFGWEKN